MTDTYSNTGTEAAYASKMPDISNDADIQKVIQAYHYGDPVNATAGSFTASWTAPEYGILGKLIYLNNTLTTLDSAKIGKSLLTAKGGLIGATAASTPAMLAAGTNGHVLKANSSTSTGLEWYSLDTTHLNLNPSDQTLTGDLTMSKASPRVAINASSGHSYITSSGASGSEAGFLLSTSSTLRWGIQKIASGDNLSIIRYNDGGSAVGTPLAIDRSTGLTTLSSLTISGATTGTTLSMSGTGSFGGKLTTVASGTGSAGLNVPTGTAPSSPISGDLWTTTDGIYVRIDSTTYPLAIVADGPGGLSADNVTSGILAGQYGGTGVNNSGKTITLGGNLTTSGAHSLTLTLSGATNVTLPTSGTLITSSVQSLGSLTSASSLDSVGTITFGTWNSDIGSKTFTHTIQIGYGVTTSGTTKTINFGTGGASGSTTALTFGSTTSGAINTYVFGASGATNTATFYGTVNSSATTSFSAVSDTATAATHYFVETGSDGLIRPKTLANVKTEIVTTAAVNSAAATTVGTITSGTWQGTAINATYIDSAIARLASPTFTGTPLSTTAAVDTNTTQIATTAYVVGQGYLKSSIASSTYAPLASPTFTGTVTAADVTITGVLRDTVTVNSQSDSYTLVLTDRGKMIECTKSTANLVTVPLNSSVAFPIGTRIDILQVGTGQVTIDPFTGAVVINATPGLKLRAQWSSCTLIKRATNTWVVVGDLTA